MLLGAGLLTGLAVGATLGGWWMLAGIVLAGALAAIAVWKPPGPDAVQRALRVVVLLAMAAMLARTFAAYVLPGYPEFVAMAAVGVATLVAAFGGDVPRSARRVLAAGLLVAAAGFVAICVAVDPPSGIRPAVFVEYPAGWLTSAVALFALFTVLDTDSPRRIVIARIAGGTVAAFAVAWAALHQVGPFRIGLSDTPFRDALVVAEAESLRTMLNVLVIVVVLPALVGVLAAACRELGTLHVGPPVRFAVFSGILTAAGAAVLSAQLALLIASTVAISATVFGWARQWLTSRGRLASGSG